MAGLSLNLFTGAGTDFEQAQYRVLAALTEVRQAFSQTIIYPHLGALVNLYSDLQALAKQLAQFKDSLPGRITKIDLEAQQVVKESSPFATPEMAFLEDLIGWALPHIQDAIEEGRTIFEFVEEHLALEEVGLVPSYVEEGYLIVPDRKAQTQHVLKYQLSIFTDAQERYRSLRTAVVQSLPDGLIATAPRVIKLGLVEAFPELPNPATYLCNTQLDFPFEATMLPIAKRKLMQHLARGQA